MVVAKKRIKKKNQEDTKPKSNLGIFLKLIIGIIVLSSIPFLFYNPDLSFGPLNTFRQDFFKTEILFSGTTYNTKGLMKAIQENDKKMVKLFVRSGYDLNETDSSGKTPICTAAEKGNIDIINILLRGDVNLLKRNDSDGLTPMFCAIKGNNIQVIEKFKNVGIGLNTRNEYADGIAPLHYAAALGLDNVITYLISSGVNIDITDAKGQTPLHKSIAQDNIVVLYVLLNSGADVDIEDYSGFSPLDISIKYDKDLYTALLKRYSKITD